MRRQMRRKLLVKRSVTRIRVTVVLGRRREIQPGFLTVMMRQLWTKWAMIEDGEKDEADEADEGR